MTIATAGSMRVSKLLLATMLIAMPLSANAQHRSNGGGHSYRPSQHGYNRGGGYHRGGNNGGALIGGALLGLGVGALVGGALAQQNYAPPPTVYYAPPPPAAYYAPPPGAYYPN